MYLFILTSSSSEIFLKIYLSSYSNFGFGTHVDITFESLTPLQNFPSLQTASRLNLFQVYIKMNRG